MEKVRSGIECIRKDVIVTVICGVRVKIDRDIS